VATLAANLSATADRVSVADGATNIKRGAFFQIDSEVVRFEQYAELPPTKEGTRAQELWHTDTGQWLISRATRGTTAATHSSGATVTAVDPFESGGGGVNVNDEPVTNIVAPGALIADGEATVLNGWTVEEDGGLFVDKGEDEEPPSSIIDALLPDGSRFRVRGTAAVLIDRGSTVEQVALDVQVPDDTTAPRFNVADDSNVGFFTILAKGMVQFGAATGASHILRVFDDEANVVFQIDTDGTVHILTGGTVVADL
jgi:hypothetical protein